MILVSRSYDNRISKYSGCIVVVSLFLCIIQLMDQISCFTRYDHLPLLMQRNSRIYRPHLQQQLSLQIGQQHVMAPSPHAMRRLPMRKAATLISTRSSILSSTTATTTTAPNDKKSKEIRIFRLPTINTIEQSRIYRRVQNTYRDHAFWVKHRSSNRLIDN